MDEKNERLKTERQMSINVLSVRSDDNSTQDILEEIQTFRNRTYDSSSPLLPLNHSPFLYNSSENNKRSTSRSPISNVFVQNHSHSPDIRNNWSQLDQSYSAPPNDADIESCWHLYAAQTNSRLLHVLSDLVKTFLDTEHDIQKQLEDMGLETKGAVKEDTLQGFTSLVEDNIERLSETNELCEDGPDLTPSSNLMYLTPPSTFNSGQSEVEVEDDVVLGASRRLRAAVDRILKLLSEIVTAHQEHDFNSVVKRNEELVAELSEECARRDKLTAQLLQIEDRVKTLEREKTSLSEKVIDYNEAKRQMESMRMKIDEYEAERDKWINDNKRLEKEKCIFAQGLPQLQQKLVSDNEALNSDVRQLQQERIKLLQRIHALALENEQLRSERDDIIDEKRKESEDFLAQIEANEKNLLSYRKFIDEQTHERELEREEFNKELMTLTERLKEKDKNEAKLRSRLEEMETQISCLTEEKYSKEKQILDMNSHLKCANHEISELRAVITQMERESDKCNQLERQLRTKVNDLNEALELQIKINEESHQDVFTTSILERITSKTHQLQNTLGSPDCESETDDTSIECSYNDVRQLSEKLNALNDCIDKLLIQNNSLKAELDRAKNVNKKDYQDLVEEKESLDRNLTEIMRSNELIQEELNRKHLNDLKPKLDASVGFDTSSIVEELRIKLIAEEQKCAALELKVVALQQQIDDNDNKTLQLIDGVNSLKHQMKTDLEKSIDKLLIQNNSLKSELDRVKNDSKQEYQELVKEKEIVDQKLTEIMRSNEILKEELSSKHLQLSALKSRLEASIDSSDMKYMVDELQSKLIAEEQKCSSLDFQIVTLKQQIDDNNNKMLQLIDEVSSLKRQIKTYDSEKSSLARENDELRLKLNSKDAILVAVRQKAEERVSDSKHLNEQIEVFKTKLESIESEKSVLIKENEELRSRISATEQIVTSLKQQINNKSDKESKLAVINDSLTKKIKALDSDKANLTKDNDQLKSQLCSVDTILISLNQQVEEKNRKASELIERVDLLSNKLKLVDSERINSIEENQELRFRLSQSEQVVHQLNSQIKDEQMKSKKLLEEIDSLKRQIKTLESEKESLLKENASLRAKLSSNDDVLVVLRQQIDERNSKITHLNQVIDSINLKFHKLESERNTANKETEKSNSSKSFHAHSEKNVEDDEKLQGVTNQFLWKLKRVISHKNALIYQKKYLLHVLGGFQLTERATLALLANMNVTVDDESPAFQTGRNRFRSVVYSIIAISRMKYLVRKWKYHNHQKSKPTVAKTVSTHSLGTTNESQTNSTLQEFVNRLQRLHDTLGLRSGQI